MPISKMILPEFDHEMVNTRKTLERVPDEKFSWKPHEKSMTLGGLSNHLANIPSWTAQTFDRDELDIAPPGSMSNSSRSKELDIAPPGSGPYRLDDAKSTAALLEAFDKN